MKLRYRPASVPVSDDRGTVAGAEVEISGRWYKVVPREGPSVEAWAGDAVSAQPANVAWKSFVSALSDAAEEGAAGRSGSIDLRT
jgi:hypothetical protein